MGQLIALLLYGLIARAQQNRTCGPIPLGQVASLCPSNPNSPPIYPPQAKAAGIEGTVKVFAQINRSGRIDLLWAVSGPEQLREAALEAVKSWIYRPYLIDGRATSFRSVINVNFTLERESSKPLPHN